LQAGVVASHHPFVLTVPITIGVRRRWRLTSFVRRWPSFGVGTGLRWKSLIGPLRIDRSWPVFPRRHACEHQRRLVYWL
jgi:hypothetical protein